ncbi:MAG TPA: uracil-DNA glycosylase [Pyrinomonadaceae bacterium]|jgi:uracil-DNA glycosylase|nr:uracil-DNA glycosylase [Pyrinomonadaceae bacterium]
MSSEQNKELQDLLKQAREYVNYFRELGAETIDSETATPIVGQVTVSQARGLSNEPVLPRVPPPPVAVPKPLFARQSIEAATSRTSQTLFGDEPTGASSLPQSTETLEEIWSDIGDCTRCGLCSGRTQVVNTHGNHKARLMFVGEAPGADEDAQGKPFVGRAGQLLTKMIEAMGMKRTDVLIGNVNRCRPPGNRQPTLEEAAICRPFLFREIATVRPAVIVVMGNTALRNLLEIKAGISSVRGRFHDYHGIPVMPTFHPAYLLRDPSKKRETWEDLKKVMEHLDQTSRGPANA